MGLPIQTPVVGQLSLYQGLYKPHWEIGHIEIRVSRVKKILRGIVVSAVIATALGFGWIDYLATLLIAAALVVYLVTPAVEWWSVCFPIEHLKGEYPDGLNNLEAGPIEFEGVVSEPGRFGHKGIMRRMVTVHRVVRRL
jgi:hypothetical protein